MEFNRRSFIAGNALLAGSFVLAQKANALGAVARKINTVQAGMDGVHIFHTSDLNGQISPGSTGYGGLELLDKNIKNHEVTGLILDGGGFLKQESALTEDVAVIEMMNRTGYNAANIGAAELGKGQDHLAKLIAQMCFTLVNCNYSFSNATLKAAVKPYVILKYGKQNIGITGIGPQLNAAGVTYRDPEKCLAAVAEILKNQENCDKIICLGALGFDPATYNNLELARSSKHIDLVIGSNNYGTRQHGTSVVKNLAGYDVFVSHCAASAETLNHAAFAGNNVAINAKVPGAGKADQAKQIAAIINQDINKHNIRV